jgi:hypothetical protein
MKEKPTEYGKTFFDIISEYPKTVFFSFLLLVCILVFFIFSGVPLKIGSVEINSKGKIMPDTIIKVERETIFVEKPKIITEHIKPRQSESSIKVKKQDTIIEVKNHPANINTGNNSGIVGNNNTVNINEKPLILSNVDKVNLLSIIGDTFKKNSNINGKCIRVSGMGNDSRSFQLAQIIFDFLKSNGYEVGDGIDQAWYNKPLKGISVEYSGSCVEIKVFIV